MSEVKKVAGVKGYKVFNHNWTCYGNTQYSCPGEFYIEGELELCKHGIHFCENLVDCFECYKFDPSNKIAEVLAIGSVIGYDGPNTKRCTDKIIIVREISWEEVNKMVNFGIKNNGLCNTGRYNTGDFNTGSKNNGDNNTGNNNCGFNNSGNSNKGDWNTGNMNYGSNNSGQSNYGHNNTGDFNIGDANSGAYNIGILNSGRCNIGNENSGDCNIGYNNSGSFNIGDGNSGDWNKGNFNSGCFCTAKEPTIKMFDKESNWTYYNWKDSPAYQIMSKYRRTILVNNKHMTKEEEEKYPECKITGWYIRRNDIQDWWDNQVSEEEKKIIMDLPNFDAKIFKECTGITI